MAAPDRRTVRTKASQLGHHIVERLTPGRISGLKAVLGARRGRFRCAPAAAQAVFLGFLIARQIDNISRGIPPFNRVEIKRLYGRIELGCGGRPKP
jgi:hypothetical protein